MKPQHLLAALTIVFVWGLNIVIGKIGVSNLPPLLFVALRSSLVGLLLIPFLKSFPPKKKTFLLLVLVFGVLQFAFLFVGLTGVDGAVAAISLQTLVPFGLILGRIKFGEKMTALQVVGLIIAFIGIIIVAGEPKTSTRLGYLVLVVLGAFSMSFGSVLIKDLGPISVFRIHGWIALCSAPFLYLSSFILESGQLEALTHAGWKAVATVAFTAIGTTIIGHGLWAYLLQNLPIYRVMPINLLSATAAVAFSIIILDEPLTLSILLGGALTISGVTIIQLLRARSVS